MVYISVSCAACLRSNLVSETFRIFVFSFSLKYFSDTFVTGIKNVSSVLLNKMFPKEKVSITNSVSYSLM